MNAFPLEAVRAVFSGLARAGGPVVLGWTSDTLALRMGAADGLVTAMAIGGGMYALAGAFYLLAARRYGADLASTQAITTGAVSA